MSDLTPTVMEDDDDLSLPFPIRSILREIDHCQPEYKATGPGVGGGKTFSGWSVPDWLMQRIRAALREVDSGS